MVRDPVVAEEAGVDKQSADSSTYKAENIYNIA